MGIGLRPEIRTPKGMTSQAERPAILSLEKAVTTSQADATSATSFSVKGTRGTTTTAIHAGLSAVSEAAVYEMTATTRNAISGPSPARLS